MLIALGNLDAELPPSVYKERQEKAPEALVIKVRSVTKREWTESKWRQTDFTMIAEVQKVERSATGLTPGATITIRYSRRDYSPRSAGPSQVPSLTEGEIPPAYLSKDGRAYVPAADGYSFETVR